MKKLLLSLMVCGATNVVAMDPCGIYNAVRQDDVAYVNDMFVGKKPYLEFDRFKTMLALRAAEYQSANVIAYLQGRGVDVDGIAARHAAREQQRIRDAETFAAKKLDDAAKEKMRREAESNRYA